MSVALYMDVHVPWAVTVALRERGVDVITAQEDNCAELDDEDLLRRASRLGVSWCRTISICYRKPPGSVAEVGNSRA